MPPRRRSLAVAWVLAFAAFFSLHPSTSIAARAGGDGATSSANPSVPRGLVVFTDSVNGGPARRLGAPHFLATGNGGIPIYTLPAVLPVGTNVIRASYLGSLSGDIPDSTPDWAPTESNDVTVEVK